MAMYALKDTTLAALGDAVRSKSIKFINVDNRPEPIFEFELDTNVIEPSIKSGTCYYEVPLNLREVFGDELNNIKTLWYEMTYECTVNGFSSFTADLDLAGYSDLNTMPNYDSRISIAVFASAPLINKNGFGGTFGINTVNYLPYFTVMFKISDWVVNEPHNLRFKGKIKIWAYDANNRQYITKNTMTPLEMVDVINELEVPNIEPIVLTGNQQYGCTGTITSQFIINFGDKISTKDITDAGSMFKGYQNASIPFEINLKPSTQVSLGNMFGGCNKLKELPKINNCYPSEITGLFNQCYLLNNIPEDYFDDWNWEKLHSYAYSGIGTVFNDCQSLKKIPKSFIVNWWAPVTSEYSTHYSSAFQSCYALEAINDFKVIDTVTLTSNKFSGAFGNCHRLKSMTFNTNEDGTPIVVSWKKQTIDLQNQIGYATGAGNIINYNSGITKDKEVRNAATYEALKNDEDWYAIYSEYSRYNHDSAVETINSLPDASAYLATQTGTGNNNTIKFKGAAGASTDGGAINTLTEEEIAVATAKGWTVTLV